MRQLLLALFKMIWKIVTGLFWLVLWGFSLGILVNYLLRWWPGDQVPFVRLLNYTMPWTLVGLIPGLLLALLARRKWLAMNFALPTFLILFSYAPLFLPRPPAALAGDASLKVMSYNIWRRNEDVEALVQNIKQEQPDILLLQEVTYRQNQALLSSLAELYPDGETYIVYEPDIDQAVVSRYPMQDQGFDAEKGKALHVVVNTEAGPIDVWNVHPPSTKGWLRRHIQLSNLIAEDIATTEGPVILGGDFNTTDQTQTYRLINQYLDNAHWQAGWGFGFSFPAPSHQFGRRDISFPSLVRIDHIFFSEHFYVREAATLTEAGGSDHLPIVAILSRVK